jgi:hypothetical protein
MRAIPPAFDQKDLALMKTWLAAALALASVASAHAAPLDQFDWRTKEGFEQAYRAGVQYGFEHGSWFRSSPSCNTEKCSIAMIYGVDGEQYAFLTWLGSAENRGNQICVQRSDERVTCANDHGHVWTSGYANGDWKAVRFWQSDWPAKPQPPSPLETFIGFCVLGGWYALLGGGAAFLLAAALVNASLFVVRRLPARWSDRIAFVTLCLLYIQSGGENTDARAQIAARVLARRKSRAMKLLEQDFAAFIAQRDAHWMQQLAQGGAAIPPERLMALVALAHPDKHNGSRLATETTQWLLSLRASQVA